ncbi:MAG: hypothetical protein ACREQ5_38220 [Candidatus Dormibacteria bacterium]
MEATYRDLEARFAEAMKARSQWEQATDHTRHLAVAADSEYRRRYPDARLEPLRSAEPPRPTEDERATLTPQPDEPDYEPPTWIAELAQRSENVREKIAERATERIPNAEDHEREDEGLAWPQMVRTERDAILQPPKPAIRPAAQVAAQAQRQQAEHEAGE